MFIHKPVRHRIQSFSRHIYLLVQFDLSAYSSRRPRPLVMHAIGIQFREALYVQREGSVHILLKVK